MQRALSRTGSVDFVMVGLVIVAVFTFASVLAPLVVIALSSLSPTSQPSIPPTGFSLRWYKSVLTDDNMVSGLQWSLAFAAGSAVIATAIGTAAAVALDRGRFFGKSVVSGLLFSPMIFPTLIFGAAILVFSQYLHLTPITRLLIAHVVLGIPFVIRLVISNLALFDIGIEEAARIHGASRVKAFIEVTVPAIRPGILGGAIFVFITSFGEVNASLFLTGPGVTTLPIHILSELQFGVGQIGIAAISTIQMIMIGVLMFVLDKLFGVSFVSTKAK